MERKINPKFNLFKEYRAVNIINPFVFIKKTPAILTDGNTACWWDFTDPTKLVTVDGKITSVMDISGNNRFAKNDNGSGPATTIDGALFINEELWTDVFPISTPLTYYIVIKQLSWKYITYIIDSIDGYPGLAASVVQYGTSPSIILYAHPNMGGENVNLPVGNWGILIASFTPGTNKCILKVNDISGTPGSVGITYPNGFRIGNSHVDSTRHSNIVLKEIIIRNVTDTTQNESTIYNYLKTKYNL